MQQIKTAVILIASGWGIGPPGAANAFNFAIIPTFEYISTNLPIFNLSVPTRYRLTNLKQLISSGGEISSEQRILSAIKNNSLKEHPQILELVQSVKNYNSKLNIILRADFFGSVNYLTASYFIDLFAGFRFNPGQLRFHFLIENVQDTQLFSKAVYALTEKIRSIKTADIGGICLVSQNAFNASITSCVDYFVSAKGTRIRFSQFIDKLKSGKCDSANLFPLRYNHDNTLNAYDAVLDLNPEGDKFAQALRNTLEGIVIDGLGASKLDYLNLCDLPEIHPGIIFKKAEFGITLTRFISENNLRQAVIIPTDQNTKALKVFNNSNDLLPGQDIVNIYELNELKAQQLIFDKIQDKAISGEYKLIVGYFPGIYKVAIEGKMEKVIELIEDFDKRLEIFVNNIMTSETTVAMTSDIGLAEAIYNNKGEIPTGTANPVPAIFLDTTLRNSIKGSGNIKDFVPTLLSICGYAKPARMEGINLLNS